MVQYTIYTTVHSHPKFGAHIDWTGRRSLALESISIGKSIYSCWDCFDMYCHQGHFGHESWSESAFSCGNLTSSKELREYLNAFCYGELGSYTVFHTAGVAVLECQRWTGFLWRRKLFIAWLKLCMCMLGRENGTPIILDLSQMFENWLTSLGLLSLFLFHWFSWVYMLYLLSMSTTQHKFSVLLCKESRFTMAFSHPSNSGNITFNRSTVANRIQKTEANWSPEWCAFSESIFFFSIRKMDLAESGKFKLGDFMTVGHCSLREFIRSIDSTPAR